MKITRDPKLTWIERVFGVAIHTIGILNASEWIYLWRGDRNSAPPWVTEVYVVCAFAITVACWACANVWTAVIATYFSAGSVLVLLQIVFLTKVFGEPVSNERLLLLFIFNVAQVILMFATWYELGGQGDKWWALFNALTVFGTLGYSGSHRVVAAQIATDFLLLALFLSHLVGRGGKE
jgi:hypothetical protein